MPDINDLKKKFQEVREAIYKELPDVVLLLTVTAKSIAEKKLRQQGMGAKYSETTYPAFFLEGKEKSGAGKKYIEKAIEDDVEVNWKGLRQAEGLPTDFVNLSFTNKMWAGMGPQTPYWKDGVVYSPLGGNTIEVVNKMNWNYDRYGDFLGKQLGKDEIAVLQVVAKNKVIKILKLKGLIK